MAKIKPKLFSFGFNRKLDKKIPILNLPTITTCPGRSPLCSKLCYANKAEICYRSAREKRQRIYNELTSNPESFWKELRVEMDALIKDYGVDKVRFHESGDFFWQDYVDAALKFMSEYPGVTFLAFTKSHMFDFSAKPKNLNLKQSYDESNLDVPKIPNTPKTYVMTKVEQPVPPPAAVKIPKVPGNMDKDFKMCPLSKDVGGEHHYCGRLCLTCWNDKDDNVYFKQH